MLFLSGSSVFDGEAGIRGGIPIAFPQFAGMGPLPNHGFARNHQWEVASVGPGSAILTLCSGEATKSIWAHDFLLTYTINFTSKALVTSLTVNNTGESPFEFQALLHTYFKVASLEALRVEGLSGLQYTDKVLGGTSATQPEAPLVVDREVDRIHHLPGDGSSNPTVSVAGVGDDGSVGLNVKFGCRAADASPVSCNVVVWNPFVAKSKAMVRGQRAITRIRLSQNRAALPPLTPASREPCRHAAERFWRRGVQEHGLRGTRPRVSAVQLGPRRLVHNHAGHRAGASRPAVTATPLSRQCIGPFFTVHHPTRAQDACSIRFISPSSNNRHLSLGSAWRRPKHTKAAARRG